MSRPPKSFPSLHYYYIKNRAIKQVEIEHDLDTELLPKCSLEEQNPASIPEWAIWIIVFTVLVAFVMCLLFLLRPKSNKNDDKDNDHENENENTIRVNSNHGNKIKEASASQDVEREIAA